MASPEWRRMRSCFTANRVSLAEFGAPLAGVEPADFAKPDLIYQLGAPPLRVDVLTSITGVEFEAAWDRRRRMAMSPRRSSGLKTCCATSERPQGPPCFSVRRGQYLHRRSGNQRIRRIDDQRVGQLQAIHHFERIAEIAAHVHGHKYGLVIPHHGNPQPFGPE